MWYLHQFKKDENDNLNGGIWESDSDEHEENETETWTLTNLTRCQKIHLLQLTKPVTQTKQQQRRRNRRRRKPQLNHRTCPEKRPLSHKPLPHQHRKNQPKTKKHI